MLALLVGKGHVEKGLRRVHGPSSPLCLSPLSQPFASLSAALAAGYTDCRMSSSELPIAGAAILVADDDADSAELLELMLERKGARVQTAATGEEALDRLRTFAADVLLLDLTLPDLDGFELLKAIRAMPGFEHTPAVAVTGRSTERDKTTAAAAGFAGYVVKPFDLEALVHLVRTLAPAPVGARMPA